MDLKSLSSDLKSLQGRQEKYEDLVSEGQGDKSHYKEMLTHYRGEAAKVRQVYLDLVRGDKDDTPTKEA
jgi:hypothetical protein